MEARPTWLSYAAIMQAPNKCQTIIQVPHQRRSSQDPDHGLYDLSSIRGLDIRLKHKMEPSDKYFQLFPFSCRVGVFG